MDRSPGDRRRSPQRLAGPPRPERAQPLRASWDPIHSGSGRPRSAERAPRQGVRRRTVLGRFVASYGWRAHAIPVLVVVTALTVFGVVTTSTASDRPASAAGSAAASEEPALGVLSTGKAGSTIVGAPPVGDGSFDASIASGVLPTGGSIPDVSTKTWHVIPGTAPQVGTGTQAVSTYTVDVEDGMDTSSFGGEESFARMVDQTLGNPKSWTHDPRFAFRRIDTGQPSFHISLSTPTTARDVCGYTIKLDVSCYNSGIGRVVINVARWIRGAIAFQGDIGSYRQYAINHEVGHGIGFTQHQPCGSNGGLAPVMMQQTLSTVNNDIAALDPGGVVPANGLTCRFNAWPFPRG
ncbi:MAG: DUF3152 domain-containing protein [Mycobacteriaceae bacterium]